jgi:GNAT superfamily N-acetyltransferase
MKCLEMIRSIDETLPHIKLSQGYSIVSINEDNAHLWEKVMDESFGNHPPGTFRYVMVANNGFEVDRVFVMLDENINPVATSSPWDYGMDNWYRKTYPEVAFVGVVPSSQGKGLGAVMVIHSLHELKKRRYTHAHLGIGGTDNGENYSAIKTYINCGFIPYIDEDCQVDAWKKVYNYLSLPVPEFYYEKSEHPHVEMPHPQRPWPYQVRCAAEAYKNGDTYIFGTWLRYNMYLVDKDRYIQLKPLIMRSDSAYELMSYILDSRVEGIFINHPLNPRALLLVRDDGVIYHIGVGSDNLFDCGVEKYLCEKNHDNDI